VELECGWCEDDKSGTTGKVTKGQSSSTQSSGDRAYPLPRVCAVRDGGDFFTWVPHSAPVLHCRVGVVPEIVLCMQSPWIFARVSMTMDPAARTRVIKTGRFFQKSLKSGRIGSDQI
jgi:hypothetical protein